MLPCRNGASASPSISSICLGRVFCWDACIRAFLLFSSRGHGCNGLVLLLGLLGCWGTPDRSAAAVPHSHACEALVAVHAQYLLAATPHCSHQLSSNSAIVRLPYCGIAMNGPSAPSVCKPQLWRGWRSLRTVTVTRLVCYANML